MDLFNVNYDTLLPQLMPVEERTAFNVSWLKVLVSPVKYVYNLFMLFMATTLYNLAHNGQVCYLKAALNDTFDNAARRIYIGDPIFDDPDFIYLRDETKPLFLYKRSESKPVTLYKRSEVYAGGGLQFVVYVPTGLVYDTNYMKALIDRYRLVSKNNYLITTF